MNRRVLVAAVAVVMLAAGSALLYKGEPLRSTRPASGDANVASKGTKNDAPVRNITFEYADYDEAYKSTEIQGWQVIVNREFLARDPELVRRGLALLDAKLADIDRVLPAYPLRRLKSVPFWVEDGVPGRKGMAYHWSADWLRDNGYNPAKAHAVEIFDLRQFIGWEPTQPWFVLHELAHAFHDRVLGLDHPELTAAYERARGAGLYASVKRNDGATAPAYALTNKQEYFAELSEAYFGLNDFFPFNRDELRAYDAPGLEMIGKAWR